MGSERRLRENSCFFHICLHYDQSRLPLSIHFNNQFGSADSYLFNCDLTLYLWVSLSQGGENVTQSFSSSLSGSVRDSQFQQIHQNSCVISRQLLCKLVQIRGLRHYLWFSCAGYLYKKFNSGYCSSQIQRLKSTSNMIRTFSNSVFYFYVGLNTFLMLHFSTAIL